MTFALRISAFVLLLAAIPIGCGPREIDTTPGRSRGSSVNGTGVFAQILRGRGHEVRAASRTSETLADWANVIVRFSTHPGLPDRDEGRWFSEWLQERPGRKLVYVVRDYDAESEFWDLMLQAEPKGAKPEEVERVERKRDLSRVWIGQLPPRPKEVARAAEWFTFDPKPPPPSPCKALGGPWAEGVDAGLAGVSRHEMFRVEEGEPVLLTGDGSPLAITWSFQDGSEVLALANGSFLLNASLLNRAKRPLAMKVVDWVGSPARHVAFLEGNRPVLAEGESGGSSLFKLLRVPPFDWISAQMMGFLLLLALSYAVRLGRPRPEAASGVERPSAHPEALGALLAKTGRSDAARGLLEAYRRWRHPSLGSGRKAPPSNPPTSP